MEILPDLFGYLALGALAGIVSGLFGIGGGVVIVPFLAWRLAAQGFQPDDIMVVAVATSLATILATSASAVYAHHRRGAVVWELVLRLSPGILFGSVLGSMAAARLPVLWFKLIFAGFLLAVAARMLLHARRDASGRWPAKAWLLVPAGIFIGSVSAILGIGGGTLSVPFLARCGLMMRKAVAVSSACGFPIAAAGTASYVALGWSHPSLPNGTVGYVYLPAVAGIIVSSVAFAPVGAKLAHALPTVHLKRMFAFVLMAIGGRMLAQVLERCSGL